MKNKLLPLANILFAVSTFSIAVFYAYIAITMPKPATTQLGITLYVVLVYGILLVLVAFFAYSFMTLSAYYFDSPKGFNRAYAALAAIVLLSFLWILTLVVTGRLDSIFRLSEKFAEDTLWYCILPVTHVVALGSGATVLLRLFGKR